MVHIRAFLILVKSKYVSATGNLLGPSIVVEQRASGAGGANSLLSVNHVEPG